MTEAAIPREFVWRRLHSLMGLCLVLFLTEHLFVNSQAALWLGDNGKGFVRMVNVIHNLPYRRAIEIFLLGVPFLIHATWGIKYIFTGKSNSRRSDGSLPALPDLKRNKAYTWQRITAWIVLIFLIFHVIQFRFLKYPSSYCDGSSCSYFVKVSLDDGLYTVADRLGVQLYNLEGIAQQSSNLASKVSFAIPSQGEVVAVAKDFGTATLLSVRDTFKYPIYVILYTIFVLAVSFHAFNGFWTFLITWGLVLKMATQRKALAVCMGVMAIIIFLGLTAIWGTYWANLRY